MTERPDDRVLVVLDVNIVLDVARIVGEPFTWEKFDAAAKAHATDDVPHPSDGRVDSLRTVARLLNGRLADGTNVEVWTSDHIDLLGALKASQPVSAPDIRDRGLGWSDPAAQGLMDDLLGGLVDITHGGSVGPLEISHWSPPLEHEDGIVLNTARTAGAPGDFYDRRFCITRDHDFLDQKAIGEVDILHPADWIFKHNAVERAVAVKKLLGG